MEKIFIYGKLSSPIGVLNDGRVTMLSMDGYIKCFIIQEKIQQHESMALLNSTSLNTFLI